MAELNTSPSNDIREAVCIDTSRIYDSCADKDCLNDLTVIFTNVGQPVINAATSVRGKKAEVASVVINVDEIQFKKGFYSVDITFYFKVTLDAYMSPLICPTEVEGLAVFSKRCVLYGSDGNVKVYSSEYTADCCEHTVCSCPKPKAKVQVIDPIILEATLTCPQNNFPGYTIPECVAALFDGSFECVTDTRGVLTTLGLFSVIRLERDVQMLIPAYDFSVPTKECCCDIDNPCDAFKRIKFPVDEFFPPKNEAAATELS